MRKSMWGVTAGLVVAAMVAGAGGAGAQQWRVLDGEDCENGYSRDAERVCEVREATISATDETSASFSIATPTHRSVQ